MTGPVRYHLGGFPPAAIDWVRLVPLIGRANAALARYDGLVAAVPNQLAVMRAVFEPLHPFKDGNGRLGRMIIPLFLFARGILRGPNFSTSGYLEARREQYIEFMRAISRDGAWTSWCAFFLEGLIEQASENQSKAQAIREGAGRRPAIYAFPELLNIAEGRAVL